MWKGHGVNDRACPAERLAAGRVGEGTVADVVPAFRRPPGCWGVLDSRGIHLPAVRRVLSSFSIKTRMAVDHGDGRSGDRREKKKQREREAGRWTTRVSPSAPSPGQASCSDASVFVL